MIVSCVLINVFHSRHFGCIFLPTWGCILLSGLSPISVGYGLDYPQNISSLAIYICLHYIIYMGYRWEKRPLINWDAHSESSVTAALGGTCAVERKRTQRNLPSLEARKRVCYLMVNSIRLHKDLMGFIGYF